MNKNNELDLAGKIALVTGSSRGIGECAAKKIAAHGAHVIVSSRKIEACQKVAEQINASGGQATAIACHIGEPDQIPVLFNQLRERFGRLDILVNNAATNPFFGHITETTPEAFQKTVDVNIRGYFFMSSEGAKLMKQGGGGSIINIASINGVIPGDFQGVYSITKAAVISMTKSFAKECASFGVRVNAVLPGATDTKFAASLIHNPEIAEHVLQHIPMNRFAQPEEISGAILYLASQASSYTTGTSIVVDGGYLLS